MSTPSFLSSPLVMRQRPTLALVVAVVVLTLAASGNPGLLDISITIAIFSLLSISVALGYGQAGILSVAQAGFAAIGAYATAIMCTRWDLHPLIGLLGALLLPALIAYPLARIVGRLSHLALAIATMVFGEIVIIVLREGGTFTGGYIGISGIPPLPWAVGLEEFSIFAWAVVIVIVAGYANLVHSSHGRGLQTIRWDVLRAQADGVGVPHRTSAILSLSAAIAGLAGWLYAHYLQFLAPESLPAVMSITAILMAVVGGTRYVIGPVIGTAVLVLIQDALPDEALQGLLYGTALVVALIAAPEGILGLIDRAFSRVRAKLGARGGPPPSDSPAPIETVETPDPTPEVVR